MKTILTPIDFSDATSPVIKEAATLSRALGGRLVLLHVTARPFIASDDAAAADVIMELASAAEKSARQELARLQRKLQADGITAVTRHRTGSPVHGIVEEAKELRADFIVVGSHGHSAFFELVAGSTTSLLLKKAPCTVVVVPVTSPKKSRGTKKS